MLRKIIISGAGPSGLASLIEFMKTAKLHPEVQFEVHIVEKRNLDFNRRQKIVNSMKREFSCYSKYPARYWTEYCQELFDPLHDLFLDQHKQLQSRFGSLLHLNKQQKFLRKLYRQKDGGTHPITGIFNLKNFSIKELQSALLEYIQENQHSIPNLKVNWHINSQIDAINFETREAHLIGHDKNEKVNFDHILICEGTKSDTIKIINSSLTSTNAEKIEYQKYEFPVLKHCAVRLRLKNFVNLRQQSKGNYFNFFNTNAGNISAQEQLKKFSDLGYSGAELPAFFMINDNFYKDDIDNENFQLRLFIVSEIPDAIYNIQDPEARRSAIVKWGRLIAAMRYNVPEDYFEFDPKGEDEFHKVNALAFKNKLKFAKNPAIMLANGVGIFLIGDAGITNFYPAGFSSVLGLTETEDAVKLICNPRLPIQNYRDKFSFYKNYLRDEISGLSNALRRDFFSEYKKQEA